MRKSISFDSLVSYSEVACATEDNRSVEERLDDVIDFIDKYGHIYNYRIKQALKRFESSGVSNKELINKRYSMYEKLSRL